MANEAFINHVTGTAFNLSLSKRMVHVLLWLDGVTKWNAEYPDRQITCDFSTYSYTSTLQSLARRGLYTSHYDTLNCPECSQAKRDLKPAPLTHHYRLTRVGVMVASLCREAELTSPMEDFEMQCAPAAPDHFDDLGPLVTLRTDIDIPVVRKTDE